MAWGGQGLAAQLLREYDVVLGQGHQALAVALTDDPHRSDDRHAHVPDPDLQGLGDPQAVVEDEPEARECYCKPWVVLHDSIAIYQRSGTVTILVVEFNALFSNP